MALLRKLSPPESWLFPVVLVSAILIGLLMFLFYVSNAASYLSDKPETCVNCHVMSPQYATWSHSSHRERAHCNDCHVPHNNVVNKYFFKGKDGLRHASVFTMRNEPQVIQIKEVGKQVVQENCIRCHVNTLEDAKINTIDRDFHSRRTGRQCWDCHREVPHGRVNSLQSVPNAKVPLPESPVPAWLLNRLNKN